MAKYKQIYLDIYKRSVFIFIGSHNQFVDWVTDEFKNDYRYQGFIKYVHEVEKKTSLASFWYNGSTGEGVIEIPKFPKTPTEIAYCTHECLHATFNILDYVGIEYNKDSSGEAHTYLLEYLVKELLTLNDYINI